MRFLFLICGIRGMFKPAFEFVETCKAPVSGKMTALLLDRAGVSLNFATSKLVVRIEGDGMCEIPRPCLSGQRILVFPKP